MTSFELKGMRPLCFTGVGADAAPKVLWSHEGSSFVPPHRDPDRTVVDLYEPDWCDWSARAFPGSFLRTVGQRGWIGRCLQVPLYATVRTAAVSTSARLA